MAGKERRAGMKPRTMIQLVGYQRASYCNTSAALLDWFAAIAGTALLGWIAYLLIELYLRR